jgi:hypothetical protein
MFLYNLTIMIQSPDFEPSNVIELDNIPRLQAIIDKYNGLLSRAEEDKSISPDHCREMIYLA